MSFTQKIRAKIIYQAYKPWIIPCKKVLDAGCGNGIVSEYLKSKLSLQLVGTDVINYLKTDIPFTLMQSPDRLPFDNLSFDYVLFNDILHHADNIETLLLEGLRVANSVLIFEDRKDLLLIVIDKVFNYFYSTEMKCPLAFKTMEEWIALFHSLDLNHNIIKIQYPCFYPLRHMAFMLNNKNPGIS